MFGKKNQHVSAEKTAIIDEILRLTKKAEDEYPEEWYDELAILTRAAPMAQFLISGETEVVETIHSKYLKISEFVTAMSVGMWIMSSPDDDHHALIDFTGGKVVPGLELIAVNPQTLSVESLKKLQEMIEVYFETHL